MANEQRLIDANALIDKFWQPECRTQTRRDFVAMVNYAPTVDPWKWASVTEVLPAMATKFNDGDFSFELSLPVLAYTDEGKYVIAQLSKADGYEDAWVEVAHDECTVVYWAPLPAPPEGAFDV